jgi:predicted phage terminase large subunit-like protein
MFGLRLGQNPQAVVTTTPRPTPLVRGLIKDQRTIITRGSTFDNAQNLAPSALAQLRERSEGTRIGRQELFAEVLDDVPGALWTRELIATTKAVPEMARVIVAVDPSGASGNEDGDSIGIVVAGRGMDGRFYVLEDATCDLGPAGWGRRAVERFHGHKADRIVAERNFGGAMVESVIRTADRNVPVKLVTASRGKAVRAEPVAALYEQKRVSHMPGMDALEDQMMQMTLTGYMGNGSPDRVDALVWALSELALSQEPQATTRLVGGLV